MKHESTSIRQAATAGIEPLCEALKHAAEQLRGEEPLLDSRRLGPHMEVLRNTLAMFLEALPAARMADKAAYLSLRPSWLEAWATDAPHMTATLTRLLGKSLPEAPPDPREALLWRLQMLAQLLAKRGDAAVRELTGSVEKRMLVTTELGFGIQIDREAHEALREWSRCDLDEFLSRWKKIHANMINRAAAVVGVAVPKKWTRSRQEDLHRRARRFARNTMI